MGTYLLSRIRDAMNMDTPLGQDRYVDCALLKGGNIRGGREYAFNDHITLEVLQSELEETKEIVVVKLPGSVLRVGLRETYQVPNPGWMQYDDEVHLDKDGYVTHVAGEPLDESRIYKVASISDFWRKRDAPSIGAYFEDHPEGLPEGDSGKPIHALLLRFFALQVWTRLWKELGFDSNGECTDPEAFKRLDHDGDGVLSKDDLKHAMAEIAGLDVFDGMDVLVDMCISEIAAFGRSHNKMNGLSEDAIHQAAKHWSSSSLASLVGDSDDDDED